MSKDQPSVPRPVSDDDADDTALRHAIALSLQESGSTAELATGQVEEEMNTSSSQATFGYLSLNRRKMEEERLLRLANEKRQRPSSDAGDLAQMPPRKLKAPFGAEKSITTPSVPFPDGAVKRTWTRGYERTSDDITIEEVFRKDELLLAVLSSFQWDEKWMLSKLNIAKTKLLLIAFANDNGQKEAMRCNVPQSIRFCFPPMHGLGSMHSKLQLLKYPEYLRIVVPTGNLVPHDWGETGTVENMIFLIDLPRLPNSNAGHESTRFSVDLIKFLDASGVGRQMTDSLINYDFSRTSRLGFVSSIPGSHTDEARQLIGYCGLGATVAALGLSTKAPVEVDIASASLGSLNRDLIEAIYNACQGDDGMKEYHERASRNGASSQTQEMPAWLRQRFRIYFPTNRTVHQSRGGANAGGTICLQTRAWRSPKFPRDLLHDCVSTREGLLMHTKMILVRPVEGSPAGASPGWAYVGSANLSESAWGRLVRDKATGKMKLNCRNWECGVVMPVPAKMALKQGDMREPGPMSMFMGTVPVPMRVPGALYGPGDQPWLYLER